VPTPSITHTALPTKSAKDPTSGPSHTVVHTDLAEDLADDASKNSALAPISPLETQQPETLSPGRHNGQASRGWTWMPSMRSPHDHHSTTTPATWLETHPTDLAHPHTAARSPADSLSPDSHVEHLDHPTAGKKREIQSETGNEA
jgi:hypothetical protein